VRHLNAKEREDICEIVDRRVERLATFCHPSIRDHFISFPHPPEHLIGLSYSELELAGFAHRRAQATGIYNYEPYDMAMLLPYKFNRLFGDILRKTKYSMKSVVNLGFGTGILNYMTHVAFHEIGHYLYYQVFNEVEGTRSDEMFDNNLTMFLVWDEYPDDSWMQWKAYHSLRNEKYADDFAFKWMRAFNY
jgi:hypothetical protein